MSVRGRRPAETYIGIPCKHGHNGERYKANNVCIMKTLGKLFDWVMVLSAVAGVIGSGLVFAGFVLVTLYKVIFGG
ncbi:hypothetical protein [Edwardsiella phage PVN06]|nr:hypothetical protein [Edwardsiella phage PVN06]